MYVAMFLAGLLTCHLLYSLAGYVQFFRASYDPEDEAAIVKGIEKLRSNYLRYTERGDNLADYSWGQMRRQQRRLYRLRVRKALLLRRDRHDDPLGSQMWPW